MQCPCGGSTRVVRSPRRKNNRLIGLLELDKCEACGRVGDEVRMYATDPIGNRIKRVYHEKAFLRAKS